MSGTAYLSSEDSALLRKALHYSGKRCLEIGAGNGGNLVLLSEKFGLVVGTDIVRPSMSDWKEAGANYIFADGASCMRDSVFDLVAFNPPYVAVDVGSDPAVEGGRNLEVPKAFLVEGLRVVRREGRVVFLLDGEAEPEEFRAICAAKGFELQRVASERGFFEELTIYMAKGVDSSSAPK